MDKFILGFRACQHSESELQRKEQAETLLALLATTAFSLAVIAAAFYSLSLNY